MASRYLLKKGYSIIGRNFRSFYGEIDLIAFDEVSKTIVFVEVKLRSKGSLSTPLESVNKEKIERIKKTALSYLSKTPLDYEGIRFDVIGILEKNGKYEIDHVENAF